MLHRSIALAAVAACAFSSAVAASPLYVEAGYAGHDEGTLAVGYELRPWLELEVGYRRADHGFDFQLPGGKRRVNDVRGYDASVRGVLQVSPRFALTGRFGLYGWQVTPLAFDQNHQPRLEERDGVSPIVGAGLRAGLTEHLDFTAEFTSTQPYRYGGDHMITAGLRLGF